MKNLILLIVLAAPGIVFSQAALASDKAIAESCKCFEGLDKKKLKEEEKKASAMECITSTMMTNIEGLAKEYGYKTSELNEENGRKIGEKFGMKLVQKCPASVPYMMVLSGEKLENSPAVASYESEGETIGTFVRLETTGEIVKVVVKTTDGEESLRWLRPFIGDEKIEQQGKSLVGKKVAVQWGEYKQYVFPMKGYAKYREILGFKIVE